eukprot:4544147-Amphidinium_carterae.1
MESDCKIIVIILRDRKSFKKPEVTKSSIEVSMQEGPQKDRQKWPAGSLKNKIEVPAEVHRRQSEGTKAKEEPAREGSTQVEAESQQCNMEKHDRTAQLSECSLTQSGCRVERSKVYQSENDERQSCEVPPLEQTSVKAH